MPIDGITVVEPTVFSIFQKILKIVNFRSDFLKSYKVSYFDNFYVQFCKKYPFEKVLLDILCYCYFYKF